MSLTLKKIIFAITFNSCLFSLLIIGLNNYNYSNKSKVNLLIKETVQLPIGFIVGTSFIGGSIIGSLLTLSLTNKK